MDTETQTLTVLPAAIVLNLIFFVIGLVVGYTIARHYGKKGAIREGEENITKLQQVGVALFIGYQISPLMGLPPTEAIITLGILALIAGERVGAAVAKAVDPKKRK